MSLIWQVAHVFSQASRWFLNEFIDGASTSSCDRPTVLPVDNSLMKEVHTAVCHNVNCSSVSSCVHWLKFLQLCGRKVNKEWLAHPSAFCTLRLNQIYISPSFQGHWSTVQTDPVYICTEIPSVWKLLCKAMLDLFKQNHVFLKCIVYATEQYSTWGLTIDLYRFLKVTGFSNLIVLIIGPNIRFALSRPVLCFFTKSRYL